MSHGSVAGIGKPVISPPAAAALPYSGCPLPCLSCLQVTVDNESYDDRTIITVDSANRPGTLVEVVQCLTELGLIVKRARISSDGGWFVDEFHVCEQQVGYKAGP